MAIFISYSHKDSDFVDSLCRNLAGDRINVWMDRWELKPGDSLVESVQSAMVSAGAILIVLSNSYVESSWCQKELNSGLIRELEGKGNIVIPVLYQDCEIPLFLKEKIYADFRSEWDSPYNYLCESLSKFMNVDQARFDTPEFHVDFSSEIMSHKETGSIVGLRYNFCEHAEDRPFSILSIVHLIFSPQFAADYTLLAEENGENLARVSVAHMLIEFLKQNELKIALSNAEAHFHAVDVCKENGDRIMTLNFEVRWMGNDTGKTVLYWADQAIVGALRTFLSKIKTETS